MRRLDRFDLAQAEVASQSHDRLRLALQDQRVVAANSVVRTGRERDVLGGDWADPVARWELLADAIAEWSTVNNPFPTLPSHPMRVVGWATLTQTGTFDDAIEFSGHADLHVDVSRNALADC